MYSFEEAEKYDKAKSKVLKYVLYKKRTEQEVLRKFSEEIESDILEKIIEELKENMYINDYYYVERTVNEYKNLKKMSLKELEYKLRSKGVDKDLISEYFLKNQIEMQEFEENSAKKIVANKKKNNLSDDEITKFLMNKGYSYENIKNALEDFNLY